MRPDIAHLKQCGNTTRSKQQVHSLSGQQAYAHSCNRILKNFVFGKIQFMKRKKSNVQDKRV